MSDEIQGLLREVALFEREAHDLFARFEASPSRIVALNDTRRQITILNLKQTELLDEGLRAVEAGLFRAAVVMVWAAFMDFLQERLVENGFAKLHEQRPNWAKYTSLEDLRENVSEFQMLDVAKATGLLSKADLRSLHGLLSKRNECAHPSGYKPGLNDALGYISELLHRIPTIGQRACR